MGKPATTYFCGNGHVMEDNAHHEMGPRDMAIEGQIFSNSDQRQFPEPCPYCGNKEEYMIIEWHDKDYWVDETPEVPHDPIKIDEIKRTDCRGVEYTIQIPVFDIIALKKSSQA